MAIIAFNHKSQKQKVQFQYSGDAFNYDFEGGMLVTFLIKD